MLEAVLIWAATANDTPKLSLISTRRTLVTMIIGYVLKLDARRAGNISLSFSVNPNLLILLLASYLFSISDRFLTLLEGSKILEAFWRVIGRDRNRLLFTKRGIEGFFRKTYIPLQFQ
jgi:hypothetical protein